ncbi:MAG: hypothetical protein JXR86_07785 [Spirochaetales bacterium]|nr:hypothetical protein [Spirochaetales bacterium]
MKMPEELPDLFLAGIKELSIDASSIIYMLKTGILGYAAAEIKFYACPCILEEVGWPRLPVIEVPEQQDVVSNDDTVIAVAEAKRIPLLSEDLAILKEASERGIPHFNTLMILNYLLLKKRITPDDYRVYQARLKEISRYSSEVLEYGEAFRKLILKSLL